ncbi:hypothetical protein K488DRAFT_72963 [Vararia minispora EC-137]|uniref:Uncharacterized protein n=1 Tax=Vararia minispora EC-137 TaxID=1314806 RepID=A0ACB8QCP8_9AGAM|nr:hypothetical protein K488DRAFT_72963 [Vararia minispora EC-137]
MEAKRYYPAPRLRPPLLGNLPPAPRRTSFSKSPDPGVDPHPFGKLQTPEARPLLQPHSSLSLHLCATAVPWVEGVGGFFVIINGYGKVPSRHRSPRRVDVALFGAAAFDSKRSSSSAIAEHGERRLRDAEVSEGKDAEEAQEAFLANVERRWTNINDRVLGLPPSKSNKDTQHFAFVEIDSARIDVSNFSGTAVDLCTGRRVYSSDVLSPRKPSFFPVYHHGNNPRVVATPPPVLAIGRANDISYVRNHHGHGDTECAILAYDKSGPFSATGDSGSGVVDGLGRLLASGAGAADSFDITPAAQASPQTQSPEIGSEV